MSTHNHGSTNLSPQSHMDTPEGEISAIQSGRLQPLPTYTELDNSTEPLISTVDPSDTRHIPPTYTQDTPLSESKAGTSFLITDELPFVPIPVPERVHISSSPLYHDDLYGMPPLPDDPADDTEESRERRRQETVKSFFSAIKEGKEEVIDLFLTRNFVTANTIDAWGKTPLLAAVETRNMRTVQQLLDAGAEPDAFGVTEGSNHRHRYNANPIIHRTPLQYASSLGHLPLVKLFLETYRCNDALIAPDGQIALRLAASNNHREVVSYLPTRRGGGFLRWKTAHARSLARAKKAVEKIVSFVKFFVWELPKFFLWSCPKHIIVLPVMKGCKYCWANKKRFYDACIFELKAMPGRCVKAGKRVWDGLKKIPMGLKRMGEESVKMMGEACQALLRGLKKLPAFIGKVGKGTAKFIVDLAKGLWVLLTVELPKMVKELSIWIWKFLTVRLPKAAALAGKWVWSGIVSTFSALWNIILKLTSLIHTLFSGILTFFQELSLTDVLNGVKEFLKAIFVTLPLTIGAWTKGFGKASYKFMGTLFGSLGKCVWWIITGLGWLAVYIPRKLWTVITSMGESMGKGLHEILVFFRPKA